MSRHAVWQRHNPLCFIINLFLTIGLIYMKTTIGSYLASENTLINCYDCNDNEAFNNSNSKQECLLRFCVYNTSVNGIRPAGLCHLPVDTQLYYAESVKTSPGGVRVKLNIQHNNNEKQSFLYLEAWGFTDAILQVKVFHWRTGAAIVWSMFSLPLVVLLYMILAQLTLSPLQWISGVLSMIVSLSTLGYMYILVFVHLALTIYNSNFYTASPDVMPTRLSTIVSFLKWSRLLHGILFSLAGGLVTWCLSGFIGGEYGQISRMCSEDSPASCLNERHLFLVLHGAFVGWIHHLCFYLRQFNYMQFPLIQQSKFFRVKSDIIALLMRSVMVTLTYGKYFYVVYFLFGQIPRSWIVANGHFNMGTSCPLNTVLGLLDLSLLYYVFLTGIFLHFIWGISATLHHVFHTQPFEFPVESNFDIYQNKCLHNALSSKNLLVQYLSYYDLNLLSQHNPVRRRQIFSLSQPGGHPHNWSNISQACLVLIGELNSSIQQHNWKTFTVAAPHLHTGGAAKSMTASSLSHDCSNGLSMSNGHSLSHRVSAAAPHSPPGSSSLKPPKKELLLQEKLSKIWLTVKQKSLLSYWLMDLPDSASRRLFTRAQLHIWAIQGLSHLVSVSYNEDLYGIIQQTLPAIIAALLDLHETVEKHFKLTSSSTQKSKVQKGSSDVTLKYSLRNSLKMALYQIVTTFDQHLGDIRLNPEQAKKLRIFQEYKA